MGTFLSMSAQEEKDWASEVAFTVKAGLGRTNFLTSDEVKQGNNVGYRIGVSADIPFSHRIGLQPSLFYTKRGTSLKEPVKVNGRLDYIDIPLALCYYGSIIKEGNDYGFPAGPLLRFKAGPYVGYKLHGKIPNANASTQKIDFGGTFGMDVLLPPFSFSVDFMFGAIPVCKDYQGHRLNNACVMMCLGYRL